MGPSEFYLLLCYVGLLSGLFQQFGLCFLIYKIEQYEGDPPKLEFIKNCVSILTCLNLSHLQSALHFMQYSYRDIFSTAECGFELAGFNALWCFCSFLFHLFHISKTFPSEDFSHQGNKKSFSGPDGVNSEHRARGSCCLWSETAEYSVQCGQAHSYITHHEMGKCVESSKNIH